MSLEIVCTCLRGQNLALFLQCPCYTHCCQQERNAALNCLAPKPPAVFFLLHFSFLFHNDWNCNSSSGYSWCLCWQVLHPSVSRRAANCLQGVSLSGQPAGVWKQAPPAYGGITEVSGTALGQGHGLHDLLLFIAIQSVINHCIFSALELGPGGLGMC